MKRIHTLEEVLASFRLKHGNRYDYSEFVYINALTKGTIICKEHGRFHQNANKHKAGMNCPKCVGGVSITLDEVLTTFHLKHQDLYDYSKFIYKNNRTRGIIICKTHGEFLMSANHHARGQGCPKCSGYGPVTQEEIIERFIEKHNGRYTYPNFKYTGREKKGLITCSVHGDFLMATSNHLAGQGCKRCNLSKGELEISKVLASMNIRFEVQKKFDNCVNIRPLPFDFYLPDRNILIEFDGRQHSEVVDQFGGLDALLVVQKNDAIKSQFCIDNNIKLIRISHKDYKQINKILLDCLHNSEI